MKKLRTTRYDITGNTFFRVLRMNGLHRLLPLGNLGRGSGLRPGLVLLVLHWVGRPLFKLLIRYEPQMHRLYLKIGKSGGSTGGPR